MNVTRKDVSVSRVLVQRPLGLVEHDLRQLAALDAGDQIGVILEMLGSVRGARREPREIIERLVMRHEVRARRSHWC